MNCYNKCTWEWCIPDYFKRSTMFLSDSRPGDTYTFYSNDDTNMAKIAISALEFDNVRYNYMCISIKSKLRVDLCRVSCYRLKFLKDSNFYTVSGYRSKESQRVVKRDFHGRANEWKTLIVQENFSPFMDGCKQDQENLTINFEFMFGKNDGIERLQTDIGAHLMNSAFSDITIKTNEGDEVPAHKILLVARSDVFRAQFQHNTAEKSTNTVECPFETDVVKDLLSYIYQDVAPNIEETAFKLLVAADYYHLDFLKELCEDVLMKQLNVNNAVELLTLADTHNASRLRKSALEFVTDKKNAAEIVKTEEWKSISNELSKSIFEFTLSEK